VIKPLHLYPSAWLSIYANFRVSDLRPPRVMADEVVRGGCLFLVEVVSSLVGRDLSIYWPSSIAPLAKSVASQLH
jgi:hypothetical protein